MSDAPIPPAGGQRANYMGAKILLAVSLTTSLAAGGVATWAAQRRDVLIDRNAWVPLGLVVALIGVAVTTAVRAVRMWDEQGSRIDDLENEQTRILTVLLGAEDEATKRRDGGLADRVEDIQHTVDEINRSVQEIWDERRGDEL